MGSHYRITHDIINMHTRTREHVLKCNFEKTSFGMQLAASAVLTHHLTLALRRIERLHAARGVVGCDAQRVASHLIPAHPHTAVTTNPSKQSPRSANCGSTCIQARPSHSLPYCTLASGLDHSTSDPMNWECAWRCLWRTCITGRIAARGRFHCCRNPSTEWHHRQ